MNEPPQSLNEAPSSPSPQNKPRARRRALILFFIGTAAILIAAIAAYLLFSHEPAATTSTSQKTTTKQTKPQPKVNQAKLIVDGAKDYVGSSFHDSFPQLSVERNAGRSPAYKATRANFYVTTEDGQALNVTPDPDAVKNTASPNAKNIAKPLFQGLQEYLLARQYILTYSWPGSTDTPTEEYETDSTICQLSTSYVQVSLGCLDKEDYEPTVKKLQPFADAMAAAGKLDESTILSSDMTIKDSPVKGYKNATVPILGHGHFVGGFAGLFYKSASSQWQYFTGTQSVLFCSNFSTGDLKKAFADETCYDGNVRHKVQP